MKLIVLNLPRDFSEDALAKSFKAYGDIKACNLVLDDKTGRSKGFGFVEMPNDSEGQAAIDAINGADLDGRPARVNEARPRPDGGGGGGRPPPSRY